MKKRRLILAAVILLVIASVYTLTTMTAPQYVPRLSVFPSPSDTNKPPFTFWIKGGLTWKKLNHQFCAWGTSCVASPKDVVDAFQQQCYYNPTWSYDNEPYDSSRSPEIVDQPSDFRLGARLDPNGGTVVIGSQPLKDVPEKILRQKANSYLSYRNASKVKIRFDNNLTIAQTDYGCEGL